jgi:predicted pyridoxine 5'-phosphate oxidase superfamily flavin-nucleotide-binding protein
VAEQLVERLQGMSLLALATVTADGPPIVGPVGEGFVDSGPLYWRIEAERMFTFAADPGD